MRAWLSKRITYLAIFSGLVLLSMWIVFLTSRKDDSQCNSGTKIVYVEKFVERSDENNFNETVKNDEYSKIETILTPHTPNVNNDERWLTIIVPTISRTDNAEYLSITLDSMIDQFPSSSLHPYFSAIKILVINHNIQGKSHEIYDANVQKSFQSQKNGNYIEFIKSNNKDTKCKDKPKACQKYDFMWILKYLTKKLNFKGYVLFLEDDWELCPNGFESLMHAVNKAIEENPNFVALRVSYGLNGVLMPNEDIGPMSKFFDEYKNPRKPPDHVIFDYFKHTKRQIVRYRYNLFFHLGLKSTLSNSKKDGRYRPPCYGFLFDWLQVPDEVYDNDMCPYDDMTPCPNMKPDMPLIDWDSNAYRLCRHHFPICKGSDGVENFQDSLKKFCRINK